MNKTKVRKSLKVALVLAFILLPVIVLAALPNPAPPVSGNAIDLDEIRDLINGIARFLIIISVIVAVVFIVWGGIRWISAQGNPEAVTNAQAIVRNGIIGALIVLGVGVILQTLAGVVSRGIFGTFNQ